VMSSASSAVTYTSVYTDSEPGRVFWGADDEEITDGGIPRVITPPVPQDEDEREAMFIQPHDLDNVPEPIYPEYILLEDEHVFLVEEQPLPPVDYPTAESPGYVTESDLEEDPEEYEDNETEDGSVDYPMDGGDDDDGDSSRDDADDEDEDEEDEGEEEEEHLALADSAIVVPTVELVELVSPPERTEPVIPPPSTDISTTKARITVRLQASISLPPEAEVERLLAMTTPSPSPPISLSPPSAGERLARCTAPPALSSPPPVPSPLLPSSGCSTQIQTLRIASTQALIDAVTAALPSPATTPLPILSTFHPPVDRMRSGESSTARPTRGRGVDYGFVSTVDVEARRQGISEVRVTELAELHERDTQDLYALLEDARDETVWIVEEEAYASQEAYALDVLTTRHACHSSLASCLSSLGESLPSMPDAYAVPDVPGYGSRMHTHDHGGSEAPDRLPDSILSSEPKPLGKHMPPPPQSILSLRESSYPP
ncbi:hypothetical protein Tco_1443252, partial [Tanacetum coccineum]